MGGGKSVVFCDSTVQCSDPFVRRSEYQIKRSSRYAALALAWELAKGSPPDGVDREGETYKKRNAREESGKYKGKRPKNWSGIVSCLHLSESKYPALATCPHACYMLRVTLFN